MRRKYPFFFPMKICWTEGGKLEVNTYCFPFSVSREKIEKAAAAAASCVLWSFTPPASQLCCNTWWHSALQCLIGYFIVILGISSHTCHLELHAVAFVLHCVLQVGVLHCYLSVSYIMYNTEYCAFFKCKSCHALHQL